MILQALTAYYEAMEKKGVLSPPGWCSAKVSFALELSEEGELKKVHYLKEPDRSGKKWNPVSMRVPQMVTRSSGVSSNFLCDNSSYFLGIDRKGKPERSLECFEAAKKLHQEILEGVDRPAAGAVIRFFQKWDPASAQAHPAFADVLEEIQDGGNLIFMFEGKKVQEEEEIKRAWKRRNENGNGEERTEGVCLVTGERTSIARIHGTMKGVPGAQSSGASLISFNEDAFESYGRKQSYNAPVGEYAAFAYTTALNYLISQKEHRTILGDTMVIYWAEDGEEEYQDVFSAFMEPAADNQEIVSGVFQKLLKGHAVDGQDVLEHLSMDQKFYILGIGPNAARLVVRFFWQDSFGNILEHLRRHYERMEIIKPANDVRGYLGIRHMMQEIVNKKSKDKKPPAGLADGIWRAVISDGRYPDALARAVLGRIRAEQSDDRWSWLSRGRAAILKACLLRNGNWDKEELTVGLNENCNHAAYILGREFSVLEEIQEKANPGINATIRDRYFNAACTTPAAVFPVLFRLKNSHLKKINDKGRSVYYEKKLGELQNRLTVADDGSTSCPGRLTLEEQELFILGYYQQTQKRYEKKAKDEEEE